MTASAAIAADEITGLVLAGGRGARMNGADKGLQPFNGMPLARHALLRLAPQVGDSMISANRNRSIYESFGAPVWPDELPDFAGPLAGFLCGLLHCRTPYLLTVPCDTPLFPADLAARLGAALAAGADAADIAMASAPEAAGPLTAVPALRPQPAFCLLRRSLLPSLSRFTQGGGRKVGQWAALHRVRLVPFDRPDDAPDAFFNANTLAELRALESR